MSYPEPCMCGADDCPRCYPHSWRDAGYDEDDPKHSTYAERQADAADHYRQEQKDSLIT